MKKILALLLIAALLIGGASGAKKILYGDERSLTTDVTTDSSGIGVVIAALNGLQTDVDALEAGGLASADVECANLTASGLLVAEDLNSTDDARIHGDLTVDGSASIGGGYIASGVVQDDLQMAAGKDLDCAAGASEFDWSLGTGITKTTSGINTIGGGTNNVILNGPVLGVDAKSWTMVGASTFVLGSTGMDSVGGTINLLDPMAGTSATFSSTVGITGDTTAGNVTASGTVRAAHLISTGDTDVLGDLAVSGSYNVEDIDATDDAVIGDDCDVVGDLTAGTIASDAGVTAAGTVQGEQITSTDDADVVADLTAGTITSDSYVTATTAINAADGEFSDDLNVTDDTILGDDCDVVGDLTAGTIASDAGVSGTTGTFSEPITVTKAIGTAPFTITSTTVVPNLNVDQVDGKDSTAFCLLDGSQALTADWDVGNFDIQATDVRVDRFLNVTNTATFAAGVVAEDLNSTDDAVINDDLMVGGLATVGETLGVTGLTTVSAVAVGVNTTTTAENPTITASDLETVYPIDASGATVTFTLPAADTVTGRLYMICADADMGANNIILATTGTGKLGGTQGSDTLTSTDADAAVQLVSDGTNYQIVSMRGTWT